MSYNAFDIMENKLGIQPDRGNDRYRVYPCPFHDDHNASLHVMSGGGLHCKSGCQIDGKTEPQWSSIIGLVMQLNNLTYIETLRFIGADTVTPSHMQRDNTPKMKKSSAGYKPSFQEAKRFARNLPLAMPYLNGRGISRESAEKYMLGARTYKMREMYRIGSEKIERYPVLRHTIPCFRSDTGTLFNICMRLDENDAKKRLSAIPELFREKVLFHLAEKRLDDLDKNYIEAFFGPKYITLGPEGVIYNSEILGKWIDGQYVPTELPVLAIVEGQYDAILLNQYGLPTVATKGHINLVKATSGAKKIVIIQDNDDTGTKIAKELVSIITSGNKEVEIVVTKPETGKDVTDLHIQNKLQAFLDELRLSHAKAT